MEGRPVARTTPQGAHEFRRRLLPFTLAAALIGAAPAIAQMAPSAVLNIIAIVNDEPISAFDLDQRLNLIIRSSNLPDTAETRQSLAPRVLRSLIDETLKLQEAKRQNVQVPEKDLGRMMRQIERQNDIPPGRLDDFLRSRGIARSTLERQLRAAISWPTVVRRKFARNIVITEEDINRALERYKANADEPLHRVSEIFIPFDSPSDEAQARENAEEIIREIRRGGNFALLARQFSQSASARRGGDLGWVRAGELEPSVAKILAEMPLNSVSEPIRTATGFHILLLRDRRARPQVEDSDATVSLRQIVLPVPENATSEEMESQKNLAKTIQETARGCADFGALSRELGSQAPGDLGRLKVKDLAPDIQGLVTTIPIGRASGPQSVPGGLRLLMVCDRSTAESKLPGRNRIRRNLMVEELEIRARRYLRDLRQTAFIDVRSSR